MATFKKTLETWYKEKNPDMNLVQQLKNRSDASRIIATYVLDKDAVEYTTEHGRGGRVYASEHYRDPSKIVIDINDVDCQDLCIGQNFTYSTTVIDLAEIQRKLESTVISVCNIIYSNNQRALKKMHREDEKCKANK